MERYNRVWRDPRSPLTPLTPRTSQVFTFAEDQCSTSKSSNTSRPSFLSTSRSSGLGTSRSSSSGLGTSRSSSSGLGTTRSTTLGLGTSRSSTTGLSTSRASTSGLSTSRSMSRSQSTSRSMSRSQITFKTEGRSFIPGSPVQQPTLSPRVRSMLNRTGNQHLTEMFTRQEIDIGVLLMMTLEDLESLGVRGAKELKLALDLIKMAKAFFKK